MILEDLLGESGGISWSEITSWIELAEGTRLVYMCESFSVSSSALCVNIEQAREKNSRYVSATVLEEGGSTAGVFVQVRGDVVDHAVDYDPATLCTCMFLHLIERNVCGVMGRVWDVCEGRSAERWWVYECREEND